MKRRASIIGIVAIIVMGLLGLFAVMLMNVERTSPAPSPSTTAGDDSELTTRVVASGLSNPWDVAFLPDETMLVSQRAGAISKIEDGSVVELLTPADVSPRGEGGMMGLAVDQNFESNRFVYACYSTERDNRVVRWRMSAANDRLEDARPIVTGIPVAASGRHSGCQIEFGSDGALWVGTGDAADESTPQDQNSLGGKILRVTRDGAPMGGESQIANRDRRVFSYGHRNVQGIALFDQPEANNFGYSAEHGPDRDDEVNVLSEGNFGWKPGAGYDESAPMTDRTTYPDAITATWSSGEPANAISGLAILKGESWGDWQNRLLVGALKDQKLLLLTIEDNQAVATKSLLEREFGRIRAVVNGPNDAIFITTDNGTDDQLIELTRS